MARSFATRGEDASFRAYRENIDRVSRLYGTSDAAQNQDTEDNWKFYDQTYSETPYMFNGQVMAPSPKSAAESGSTTTPGTSTPGTTPGTGTTPGSPAAGVAVPEPTVSALSAYGTAGNQNAGVAANTTQSISGPESANPSLGKRIYPQHMRQLAALSPRVY